LAQNDRKFEPRGGGERLEIFSRVCQSSSGDLVAASLKLVKNHLGIIRKVASHSQELLQRDAPTPKEGKSVYFFVGRMRVCEEATLTRVMLIKDYKKKIKGNDIWISDFFILFGRTSFVLGLFYKLPRFWALRKETMSRLSC